MRERNDYRRGITLRTCDRCDAVGPSNHILRQYNGMYCCDRTINNCLERRPPEAKRRNLPAGPRPLHVTRPPADYGFSCFTPCVADLMVPDCTTCDVFGVPNG